MIKLFRNIRKNLLAEGKSSRYLKYAIGEIILVVIGILIALQINNWKELQKEHLQEQTILKRLKQEFESNKTQLENKVAIRNRVIESASDLLVYFDTPEIATIDSIYIKHARLLTPTTFDPIQNNLVESGTLEIIRNEDLKRLLINWSTDVIQLQETEQMFMQHNNLVVIPYLSKLGIHRNVVNAFWEDNLINLLENNSYTNPVPKKSRLEPITKNELLNDAQFESLIAHTLTLNVFNNQESKTLMNRIDEILNLLNSETRND